MDEFLNQVRPMIDSKRSKASCIWFYFVANSQMPIASIHRLLSHDKYLLPFCLRQDIGRTRSGRPQTWGNEHLRNSEPISCVLSADHQHQTYDSSIVQTQKGSLWYLLFEGEIEERLDRLAHSLSWIGGQRSHSSFEKLAPLCGPVRGSLTIAGCHEERIRCPFL